MCKQIQEDYSSCDVSPIHRSKQSNRPTDPKPTRYQTPCWSSKSLVQAISQTFVSLGRPTLSRNFSLTKNCSSNITCKQPLSSSHSAHQHSPVRTLFPPRDSFTLSKQHRNNSPCRKQHPQRQTLDRRASSRIHRSTPATRGTEMCRSRRHCRHAVQDPRRSGCYHRRPNARRRWMR